MKIKLRPSVSLHRTEKNSSAWSASQSKLSYINTLDPVAKSRFKLAVSYSLFFFYIELCSSAQWKHCGSTDGVGWAISQLYIKHLLAPSHIYSSPSHAFIKNKRTF